MASWSRRLPVEQLLEQERGVLVACHAWRYPVAVGHVGAQLYLEAIVVESSGVSVSHARELEVVRGYYSCDVAERYILEEKARAVELVSRVGALEYLVEYYESVLMLLTEAYELSQTQQFRVEITYAPGEVVGGAHAREQREHRHAQSWIWHVRL